MSNIPFYRILRPFLMLTLIFSACYCQAQQSSIYGTIRDAANGESLIGATIAVPAHQTGVTTNHYGFYSLSLPQWDTLVMVISYLGYEPQVKKIYSAEKTLVDIHLIPSGTDLELVEVTADKVDDRNVTQTQMGVLDVPLKLVKELPAILGEADVMKVIQLLPGVQSGNEGTTGFHVRGGNADQNLVQLDEATVYNPNHLFGLLSTFNTAAINNVTLIKGGFPVQYGGRLSSILDISMKEGNDRQFKGDGGIGLISSRLTLEGPIIKEKASYILSARRTYLDVILKPFLPRKINTNYHFYDLNAKVNYRLGQNDRLFASFFKGSDLLNYEQAGIFYKINFGNTTGTLRWNHIFGDKLFANTSLIYNDYDYSIEARQNSVQSNVISGIRDLTAKMEFNYYPHYRHQVKFGGMVTHHTLRSEGNARFNPGTQTTPERPIQDIPKKRFTEAALYLDDDIRLSQQVSLSGGVRLPFYSSDSARYTRIEPRLGIKWQMADRTSVKAAYTLMNQFIHLIPGSAASIPYDIWAPSSKRTLPQTSQQVSLGVFHNLKDNNYEMSLEIYYKDMENQVLFKEGNQLAQSLDIDPLLTYGKGWSYGAELFIQKNTGKLTGWVSYTLSRTDQRFGELNFGQTFPYRYDKRHNLSVTGSYAFNQKWSFASTFVFTSGAAFTVPTGRISAQEGASLFEGNYFIYEERNNVRMPAYHRLDVSAIYKKQRSLFGQVYDSEWVFSLYNLYSRQNPYFIYFQVDVNTDQPQAKQVSLLPIIPSVSYNFKF